MSRTRRLALISALGVLLIVVTYTIGISITTRVTEERVRSVLETVRDTTLEGLETWMDDIKRQVTSWARTPSIAREAQILLSYGGTAAQLRAHPSQLAIRATLGPIGMEEHHDGFIILDRYNTVLAASDAGEVGTASILGQHSQYLNALFSGQSFVSNPVRKSSLDSQMAGQATILAGAPIHNTQGTVIAGLVFYIDPKADFSRILQAGRMLRSGDTYAVDANGFLVSESRFDEQLRDAGIIASGEDSILNIRVTDPGANLMQGETGLPEQERLPTRVAASLLRRETDSDVSGYNDYRGVRVAGAWTWNDEYNFGIVTETDWDESFANIAAIRPVLILLSLISGAALVGAVVLSNLAEHRERVAQKRYELTVEGAMDAIISFNTAGHITSWNPQAEVIFGWDKTEALGTSLAAQILPDELKERYFRPLQQLQDEKEAVFATQRREYELKRRDGSFFPSEFFLVPYQLGEEKGFSAFIRDVTDIREAERQVARTHQELTESYDATLQGWSTALDLRDNETEGHTQRVTDNALRLAKALGTPEEEQLHIYRGALLHDIGKIGIPDRILLKPGPLDAEEWEVMRMHPVHAYNFLKKIPYLRPALDIPHHHHEKWDGSGYPLGLAGEAIPYAARMFAVVDVWDALTSDRPYRKAWSTQKARAFMSEQRGKHFDPNILDIFLETLET